jgi:hypothetical protein
MDIDSKLFDEFVALTRAHAAKRPLPLGTETAWGTIAGIVYTDGERSYLLVNALGVVSLMPAEVVERVH